MVWSCSLQALLVLSALWMSFADSAVLLQELADSDEPEMTYCDFDPALNISACYIEDDSSVRIINPVLEGNTILPEYTLCRLIGDNDFKLFCEAGQWTRLDQTTGNREKRWGRPRQNKGPSCPSEYNTISNGRTRCVPSNNLTVCCYNCNGGYQLVGQQRIICRNNVWHAPKPVCQVRPVPPVTVRPAPPVTVICEPGSYATGDGTCTLCAMGYYQERENMTTCTQCPDGKTTSNTGTASVNQCIDNIDVLAV